MRESMPTGYSLATCRSRESGSVIGVLISIVMGALTAWAIYYTPQIQMFMGVMQRGIQELKSRMRFAKRRPSLALIFPR